VDNSEAKYLNYIYSSKISNLSKFEDRMRVGTDKEVGKIDVGNPGLT